MRYMRIGIDASRAFVPQRTGTERYGFEMITRMLALPAAKKHEWVLYVKVMTEREKLQIPKGDNIQVVEIGLTYLWTQVGVAYRTWIDRLDCLWIPAHTLPVLRRGFGGVGRDLKTVVTIHGIEYEWLPAYENILQRWYLPLSTKYAVKAATKVIAVSKFSKEQLVKRLKAEEKKIQVVVEGYQISRDTSQIDPEATKTTAVMQKFNLKPKKYLLYVGTVQPRKNLVRLIEAVSGLPPRYADIKLVICGKLGWNYKDVLAAADRVGRDRVVVTDYTDDRTRQTLLSEAAVYVQPSITEGFGLPVIEAMDIGIPVATSNGGALPEVAGRAAEYFDPFNIEQMKLVLARILDSKTLQETMIKAGKEQIKKFNWDRSAKQVLKLLTYNI